MNLCACKCRFVCVCVCVCVVQGRIPITTYQNGEYSVCITTNTTAQGREPSTFVRVSPRSHASQWQAGGNVNVQCFRFGNFPVGGLDPRIQPMNPVITGLSSFNRTLNVYGTHVCASPRPCSVSTCGLTSGR